MKVTLILVPYHLGQERVGMGLGPECFIQRGISRGLNSQDHDVIIETVRYDNNTGQGEFAAVAEINALLAEKMRAAVEQRRFPLVLAGNCNSCLGALAGLGRQMVGIVWLDAHGDFNTPQTSTSDFLDGMALAMATGLYRPALLTGLGGLPIPGSHVVHIGGRDFDAGERERLVQHGVHLIPASQLKQIGSDAMLRSALALLRSQAEAVYLHVDLDVLDPAEGRANEFAAPHGLSLRGLECIIQMVGETFAMKAAALTAYDPTGDEGGRALRAGLRLIHTIVKVVDS